MVAWRIRRDPHHSHHRLLIAGQRFARMITAAMDGPSIDSSSARAPLATQHVRLRDGTPVLLRPITPADREAVAEAFRLLSPESRYHRFWVRARELNPRLIDELSSPDNVNHVAWAAIHEERDDLPGIGGGSFWRINGDSTTAEVSFTVADEFQGRGVATLMMAALWIHARSLGIERFVGYVLDSNLAMRAWFDALGASAVRNERQWIFHLLLDESLLPSSHAAVQLNRWLGVLRGEDSPQ